MTLIFKEIDVTQENYDEIKPLFDSCSRYPAESPGHINEVLKPSKSDTEADGFRVIGVYEKDDLVGFLSYIPTKTKNCILLHKLAIRSDCQNKGYGELCLNYVKALNYNAIVVLSPVDQEAAHRFYERNQFVPIVERQARYNYCVQFAYSPKLNFEGHRLKEYGSYGKK